MAKPAKERPDLLAAALASGEPGLFLGYDTETSGLPLYKEPNDPATWVRSADPRQPHIIEIAALLVDVQSREIRGSLNTLIKPDGWTCEPEAFAAHGITLEEAGDNGIPEDDALEAFLGLWEAARWRVGFNEDFDARIIRIAKARFQYDEPSQERWKAGAADCAMHRATPICKLPHANGRGGFKWPTLSEAHAVLCPEHEFEETHRALADTEACLRIYWALRDRAPAPNPAGTISVY